MSRQAIRERLKKSPLFPALRYLGNLRPRARRMPRVRPNRNLPLKHLGTDYGGWTFVDRPDLQGATIISAGLGEDASFDVEFARYYGARVIVVDPTPRAIAHYGEIMARIGSVKSADYVAGGNQPVAAYPLDGLRPGQLVLVEKALWNERGSLRFFLPKNREHVSHSVVNFQQDYRQDTDHIEVEAITIADLRAEFFAPDEDIPLLKLDIEGAEIEVLADALAGGITPRQLCIEFDELNVPSRQGAGRVESIDALLRTHGYDCVHADGKTNFLYVRA